MYKGVLPMYVCITWVPDAQGSQNRMWGPFEMELQRVVSPIIGARSPLEEQLLSTEPSLKSLFF